MNSYFAGDFMDMSDFSFVGIYFNIVCGKGYPQAILADT
jgi:hypothetical protein